MTAFSGTMGVPCRTSPVKLVSAISGLEVLAVDVADPGIGEAALEPVAELAAVDDGEGLVEGARLGIHRPVSVGLTPPRPPPRRR